MKTEHIPEETSSESTGQRPTALAGRACPDGAHNWGDAYRLWRFGRAYSYRACRECGTEKRVY